MPLTIDERNRYLMIAEDGEGWAVEGGAANQVLRGRWASERDARGHGLAGVYLLSGTNVVLIARIRWEGLAVGATIVLDGETYTVVSHDGTGPNGRVGHTLRHLLTGAEELHQMQPDWSVEGVVIRR